MYYKKSELIKNEIEKAKKVLINCHRGPDPDSIGSALSMYYLLHKLGKKAEIICPSDRLYQNLKYLKNYDVIQKGMDFSNFDFSNYDLFVILDSSSWEMVSGNSETKIPDIRKIVIDHHATNMKFGDVNIVDDKATSTGELMYKIYKDLDYDIDKIVSNYLMVAIVGDTGAFRFPGIGAETFLIVADLINKGADKDKIVQHIYRSEDISLIRFYKEVLNRIKFDKKGKFVWAAIPYNIFKKLGKPQTARESAASAFFQIVSGTDFGFLAVEETEGILSVSFRSRTGIDTSEMAKGIGGGGHVYASGAKIKGMSFDGAVDKLLQTVKRSIE